MAYVLPLPQPRIIPPINQNSQTQPHTPQQPKLVLPPHNRANINNFPDTQSPDETKKRKNSEIDDAKVDLIVELIKEHVMEELFKWMIQAIEPQIHGLVNKATRQWEANMTALFDSKVAKLYGNTSKCVESASDNQWTALEHQLSEQICSDVLKSLGRILSQHSDV